MKVIWKLLLCFVVSGLLSAPVSAAVLDPIFRLEMDGQIDPNSNPEFEDYINDSADVSVPVRLRPDESGDFPAFDGDTMYMDGTSNYALDRDEAMIVEVGDEYDLTQNYLLEAWIKPDYDYWPTGEDNTWGQIFVVRWWQIGDWCDIEGTVTQNLSLLVGTAPDYNQRIQAGSVDFSYLNESDPNISKLPGDEFTHVALVWQWDSESGTGTAGYYVNGELKGERVGSIESELGLPSLIGIGNQSFSAIDDYCGNPDVNYNGGFSGWFDSVAISTFTGEFEGPQEFLLADPQECGDVGTEYAEADLNKDCVVDMQDFAIIAEQWLDTGYIE